MSIQQDIQEELAWADHYERKAAKETDPTMKAEWEAQAEYARLQARLMQTLQDHRPPVGDTGPGSGGG